MGGHCNYIVHSPNCYHSLLLPLLLLLLLFLLLFYLKVVNIHGKDLLGQEPELVAGGGVGHQLVTGGAGGGGGGGQQGAGGAAELTPTITQLLL